MEDFACGTYKTYALYLPGVEKKLCRFFESKTFGVCNAFLHTKLEDQLETWHSKTLFDRGAECL